MANVHETTITDNVSRDFNKEIYIFLDYHLKDSLRNRY